MHLFEMKCQSYACKKPRFIDCAKFQKRRKEEKNAKSFHFFILSDSHCNLSFRWEGREIETRFRYGEYTSALQVCVDFFICCLMYFQM